MSARPCKGCGRPVVFAKDPDGKWQVLDNTAPCWRQVGEGRVIREHGVLVSHFATCPKASDFSARNRTEAPLERNFYEPKEVA